MAALDHATLQAVLDKQGMPNTTENLNRIAQFAAVAPDMLDKYLGKGTDASRVGGGSGVDASIDRSIASTADPRLAALAGPNPLSATIDPNTGLTNVGPGLVKGQAEPRGVVQVGQPRMADNANAGKRGTSAVVDPGLLDPSLAGGAKSGGTGQRPSWNMPDGGTGVPTESETDREGKGGPTPQTHAGDTGGGPGTSWTNLIVPSVLALFAAQMARRGGAKPPVPGAVTPPISQAIPNAVPQPLPQVPTRGPVSPVPQPGAVPVPNVPPPAPNVQPAPTANARPPMAPGPGQTAADVARMQAEVDAENAANLQTQMKNRARSGGGGGRTVSP